MTSSRSSSSLSLSCTRPPSPYLDCETSLSCSRALSNSCLRSWGNACGFATTPVRSPSSVALDKRTDVPCVRLASDGDDSRAVGAEVNDGDAQLVKRLHP